MSAGQGRAPSTRRASMRAVLYSPASGAVVAGSFFVDLDDTYFRGGDRLQYFWTATDAAGGRASAPIGIDAAGFPPVSVQAAERALDGLYEVSFLPTINWAPSYLARIAAAIRRTLPGYGVDDFLTAMQFAPEGEKLFRAAAQRMGMT